jgi:uncharacterized Tic20 family protein
LGFLSIKAAIASLNSVLNSRQGKARSKFDKAVGMYDPDKRKLLSALCHGSIFFSLTGVSIGLPLAILFVSDDPIVKENAKEALNFHFNVWLYGIIFGVLTLILIGFVLLGLLQLLNIILPVLAILKSLSDPDQSYRYPFIFRLL